MGITQPYYGTYYSASSASEKLDIDSILDGCKAVEEEANHISEYTGQLSGASSTLGVDALSVNGMTIEATAEEYCDGINQVETEIMNVTAQIREAVESAYNQIQDNLNYEAQVKDQAEYNRRMNSR